MTCALDSSGPESYSMIPSMFKVVKLSHYCRVLYCAISPSGRPPKRFEPRTSEGNNKGCSGTSAR
jgi:hypothetical protein